MQNKNAIKENLRNEQLIKYSLQDLFMRHKKNRPQSAYQKYPYSNYGYLRNWIEIGSISKALLALNLYTFTGADYTDLPGARLDNFTPTQKAKIGNRIKTFYRGQNLQLRNVGEAKSRYITKLSESKQKNSDNPKPKYSEDKLIRIWEQFLKDHLSELQKKYKNKYIAMLDLDDEPVDSDTNLSALAERVYDKYGYRPIFMPFISDEKIYRVISIR